MYEVFPTHVGVFPILCRNRKVLLSLPHACGGVSMVSPCIVRSHRSSPRMWGCFQDRVIGIVSGHVFPTHVGVFLPLLPESGRTSRLPHACGGVSYFTIRFYYSPLSSPRMWGCFSVAQAVAGLRWVFPTHVGVFLDSGDTRPLERGLPHACGGVSGAILIPCCGRLVFPTHVGVFLRVKSSFLCSTCLPHACGGVSLVRMT